MLFLFLVGVGMGRHVWVVLRLIWLRWILLRLIVWVRIRGFISVEGR